MTVHPIHPPAHPNVTALVTEYLALEAHRAEITARQDHIKAFLRTTLPQGKHELDGTGTVTISVNRRFDAALAEQVLTNLNPALLDAVKETVISSAKAKKVLPPATYEQCMRDAGDPRISIGGLS